MRESSMSVRHTEQHRLSVFHFHTIAEINQIILFGFPISYAYGRWQNVNENKNHLELALISVVSKFNVIKNLCRYRMGIDFYSFCHSLTSYSFTFHFFSDICSKLNCVLVFIRSLFAYEKRTYFQAFSKVEDY